MKKFANPRPLCVVALCLMATLFVAQVASVFLVGVWLLALCAGLVFFLRDRVLVIMVAVVCAASVGSFYITNMAFEGSKTFEGVGELRGTVTAYTKIEGSTSALVTLVHATFDGEKLAGRVSVMAIEVGWRSIANIAVGNIVAMQTQIKKNEANAHSANEMTRYKANISDADVVEFVGLNMGARYAVSRAAHGFLHKFMSPEPAELMFSMLLGNKSDLGHDTRHMFAASGLAHLLAVSGLHVGLIIGIFAAALALFRVPRRRQFWILLVALVVYNYFIDVKFSAIRSSIMFMVLLWNTLYRRRGDLISSLSFAAIIILVLFPFSLQSISFILSFGCLLGFAIYYKPLDRLLRPKLGRGLSSAVCMYLAVTIVTMPIVVTYFGYISFVELLGNLVAAPFILVAFQLSVIACITVVGFPLLLVANAVTSFALLIERILTAPSWIVMQVGGNGVAVAVLLVGLVLSSRYMLISKRAKVLAAGACLVGYLFSLGALNS